ncbi:MAG TPA: hypothetical protein VHO03_13730 [Ignavibacteriales bacterium]|nr:hypothetical protein [Ignavibacteriales bacterium]
MKPSCGFIFLLLFSGLLIAQGKDNSWIIVKNTAGYLLQADISTLKKKEKADVYVWGLQSYKEPIVIEGIGSRIYKVKTYYLINTELLKYSILKVTYYGSENRRITEFSYFDEMQQQSARYNYPILPGSDVEAIYNTTAKYLTN